jgi:hypothetical protein
MDREKENQLILIASRWEAICDILDGKEASDFMVSFPEVRQVADLYAAYKQAVEADAEHQCECPVSGFTITHKPSCPFYE